MKPNIYSVKILKLWYKKYHSCHFQLSQAIVQTVQHQMTKQDISVLDYTGVSEEHLNLCVCDV